MAASSVETQISQSTALSSGWNKVVSADSLAIFRIGFGLVMAYEMLHYFLAGWIYNGFIHPPFHFSYFGFEWVRVLPGHGMLFVFGGLGLCALLIAAGYLYRWAMILWALGFSYIFLIDEANYLNHFYMIALVSWLMVFMPLHTQWAMDARTMPEERKGKVPAWCLWALRAQIGIVYLYAGVAKINGDWVQGEPMRLFLQSHYDVPVIGEWLRWHAVILAFAWSGMLLDLSAPFLLLWRRTRLAVFILLCLFHSVNSWMFSIGVFPMFMLLMTTLYFDTEWWQQLLRWMKKQPVEQQVEVKGHWYTGHLLRWGLALYFIVQLLVPLRHHLYPGSTLWTEQGHRFSWRMKLRIKSCTLSYRIVNPATGDRRIVTLPDWLTERQRQVIVYTPDMILQFAHCIAEEEARQGRGPVEVYALSTGFLHGRQRQSFIDSSINLAEVKRSLKPVSWITPLQHPLPPFVERIQPRIGKK